MNNNQERKGAPRLTRVIIFAVSAIMLFSMLALFTFAADSTSPYDAQFGELYYENLSDAISAANSSENGGTVTLLRDTTLAECLTISKDVTLTGEYTIYRADTYTATLFTVNAGTTLTLDGGITIDGNNDWVLDMDTINELLYADVAPLASLNFVTPESGAPVATDYMLKVNGGVVLNNATVQNNCGDVQTSVFYIASTGKLTMNSGSLITHNAAINTSNVDQVNASVAYVLKGGTFTINKGAEVSYNYSKGNNSTVTYLQGQLTLNGGSFNHNVNAHCCGTVAMIDGGTFTMKGGSICENTDLVNKTSNSIGISGAIYLHSNSKFVMDGGIIEKNYSNGYTTFYSAKTTGVVRLNAGTVRQEPRTVSDLYSSGFLGALYIGEDMIFEGGSIYIRNNFTFNTTIDSDVTIESQNKTTPIVFSGDGVITGDVHQNYAVDKKNNDINSTTTIQGGSYLGEFTIDAPTYFSVTGGRFKTVPTEYLVSDAEIFYDSKTELYSVYSGNVASFGGAEYATLAEAIAAANIAGGGEVSLLRPTYLAKSISISSDITLSGAYSVVRSDSYTGTLFNVAAGATLTLDGGITIDGGNEWTLTDEFMIDLNAGIPVSRTAGYYVVPEGGAPVGSDYMIKISGQVVVNNATVCNNYTDNNTAAAFYVADGANLTTNSGAVLKDNCAASNNPLINCAATGTWIINEGTEIYGHYAGSNGGLSYMKGQVTMNGGNVHDNYLNCGAGTFFMLYGPGSLTMNGGHVHDNYNIPNGTGAGGVIYVHYGGGGGKFTMNGGVIEANHGINNTVITCSGDSAKVYLNGGIIRHEVSTNPDWTYDSQLRGTVVISEDMLIEGGRIRIRCPEITIDGTVNSQIVSYLAQTTIKGSGTINGDVNIIDATAFVIESGKWLGKMNVAETGGLSIKGGSFRENPSEWLAEGYGAVYNPDSEMYGVELTPVAAIGEVGYDTIAEALTAAADGDVIKIAASHKIREPITINKNVTIDTGNQTLIVDKSVAVAFVIKANTTFRGSGTVNTDNGNTAVFAIGDADTEGSLTIESGSYIGESTVASVENGSLTISGGDFSVNPDVAEGETADHSALLAVNDSANARVAITGGRFRSFNPDTAGGGYLEDSHDAVEENDDYYNVLTHIFEHYVSDGNATCTTDGTKTAKCKFCELTDTITEVGSMLQHAFLHYVSDGNATCDSDGTKTAKCEHCDVTVTVTDARSALGHLFENYVSDGNATCEANGTRTAKCEHCDATRTIMESRSKLAHTYDGLTCTACGHLRIWLVAIIAFCCVALLMLLPLMII